MVWNRQPVEALTAEVPVGLPGPEPGTFGLPDQATRSCGVVPRHPASDLTCALTPSECERVFGGHRASVRSLVTNP